MATVVGINVPNWKRLISELLDKGYNNTAVATLNAIGQSADEGVMKTRWQQLEAEAYRLAEAGETFTVDNPVLRAVFADVEVMMARNAERLNNIAEMVEALGVDAASQIAPAMTFDGLPVQLKEAWNQPDPEVLRAAVRYSNKSAWAAELKRYRGNVLNQGRQIAIRGIVNGKGPITIARDIRVAVSSLPTYKANTLARTLQLSSFRQGTAMNYAANAGILVEQIRVAVLDTRTCMACVVLSGTRLPIDGKPIADHHNGRCTSIAVVKGYNRIVPLGTKWFEDLSEADQVQKMGFNAYEEWQAGKFNLQDYVQPYHDDVFGNMVRQASLKEILSR